MTAATGAPAGSAHRRRRRAVVTGGILGALALVVALTGDPVSARRVRSEPDAVGLLRAAADAARRVPYEGKQMLTTRSHDRSATARATVAHRPGEGIRYRSAAGAYGYRPEAAAGWSTGFTPATLDLLTRNYTVVQMADASMCDRPAHVVEARRTDGTTAGRFWLDAETGLMLHRELIDASGRPIVSTGFTEITFALSDPSAVADDGATGADSGDGTSGGTTSGGGSGDAPARPLRRRGSNAAGAPEQRTHSGELAPAAEPLGDAELARLRDAGWPVPVALTGGLLLHDARRHDGALHLSYSDGLAAVSVFVQRGTLDEARMRGWERDTRKGRTVFRRTALRRWAVAAGDGFVYTVLTDGPSGAAESVARELPGDSDPLWERLARGARHLIAMVNPFG